MRLHPESAWFPPTGLFARTLRAGRGEREELFLSANRRRVEDAALVPEPVQAALEAQRLQVGVEAFAVVADLAHDVEGPAIVERKHLAEVAGRADKTLDRWVGALRLLVDVLRAEAELLGLDHRAKLPFHHVDPAVVAVADGRLERLLRDDLRKDHVLVGLGGARLPQSDEPRVVGGEDIA